MFESDSTSSTRLGVKEAPILEFIEVNKYIYPILRNQINSGNDGLYNSLDYGNELINNIATNEDNTCKRNNLLMKMLIYWMTVKD